MEKELYSILDDANGDIGAMFDQISVVANNLINSCTCEKLGVTTLNTLCAIQTLAESGSRTTDTYLNKAIALARVTDEVRNYIEKQTVKICGKSCR